MLPIHQGIPDNIFATLLDNIEIGVVLLAELILDLLGSQLLLKLLLGQAYVSRPMRFGRGIAAGYGTRYVLVLPEFRFHPLVVTFKPGQNGLLAIGRLLLQEFRHANKILPCRAGGRLHSRVDILAAVGCGGWWQRLPVTVHRDVPFYGVHSFADSVVRQILIEWQALDDVLLGIVVHVFGDSDGRWWLKSYIFFLCYLL